MTVPIAASGGGSSALPLLFVIVIIGAMYFLMIRPQQRRNRQIQSMQSSLGPGDEVMTSSGIYGEVLEIDETEGTVTLEVAPDVAMKFARGAIGRVVTAAAQDESLDDEADDETDHVEPYTAGTAEAHPVDADPVIERRKD